MVEGGRERLPVIVVPAVQVFPLRPVEGDMEVFLGLRATRSHRLQWAPPGGHVDPGETDEAAGVRELFEEAGGIVPKERLIFHKDWPSSLIPGNLEGRSVLFESRVRAFILNASGLELSNVSPREHVEMKWWRLNDALRMHERILASRPDTQNRHFIPGTLTQGTERMIRWLLEK